MTDLRVELKICEGCGAMWLRTMGEGATCRRCTAWLAEFPVRRRTGWRGPRGAQKLRRMRRRVLVKPALHGVGGGR